MILIYLYSLWIFTASMIAVIGSLRSNYSLVFPVSLVVFLLIILIRTELKEKRNQESKQLLDDLIEK